MTNAERQAQFQRRRRERIEKCVTPDEVVKATRLLWEAYASDPLNQIEGTWEDFLKRCHSNRGHNTWLEMAPDSADPEDYEGFDGEDRALLARVGAVVCAVKRPPK